MFLLDTNIISEPTKREPDAGVLRTLAQHSDELAIASIVWHELWFGADRLPAGKRRDSLRAYLEDVVASSVPVLPYDAAAAHWHARERARLSGLGITLPFADGQIAATAMTNDMTVVTRNVADFQWCEGLRVENWFEIEPSHDRR